MVVWYDTFAACDSRYRLAVPLAYYGTSRSPSAIFSIDLLFLTQGLHWVEPVEFIPIFLSSTCQKRYKAMWMGVCERQV
jgi:hypothetical protein